MTVRILVGDAIELRTMYYDKGMSLKQISAATGINHHTIRSRLRRAGMQLRSRGEGSRLLVKNGCWPRGRVTSAALKDVLKCRKCDFVWRRIADGISQKCPSCGSSVEARKRKGNRNLNNLIERSVSYPEAVKAGRKRHRKSLRRSVLLLIGCGVIRCSRCGCDDERMIEINHKNGGGAREYRSIGSARFYYLIAKLERDVSDLELCCRVCNSLHYLEQQYGNLPFTVRWGAE